MKHNRRLVNWFIQHDKKEEPKSMSELIKVNLKPIASSDSFANERFIFEEPTLDEYQE